MSERSAGKNILQGFKENDVFIVVTNPEKLMDTNISMFRFLVKEFLPLYITVNRPFHVLEKQLKQNGVDPGKILFIDCITQTASSKGESIGNCIYLASPSHLTEMSIAITEVLSAMPDRRKVVFIDTLSTLLMYNPVGVIAKFSHFLINKIKLHDQNGIFMVIEDEMDKTLMMQIGQFVDKVIKT